ncbi:phosphate metabolism protein 7 [Clarireedia jacksonii]
MSRAWIATDCKDLTEQVEERDKIATKLENAELKLIKTANKLRLTWEKKYTKADQKGKAKPKRKNVDEEAAVISEWMKKKDRSTHRLGKIPLIGKKVDTICWSRTELQRLIPEIQKGQKAAIRAEGQKSRTIFVEFRSQAAADAAYRKMSAKKPPHMDPQAIAITPDEVIWNNLRIKKLERRLRVIGTSIFLSLMIIFWANPVAVVGAISNINYLTSTTTLLAKNLPKASNFFISYIIVQGLEIAAGNLLDIGSLIMFAIVGKFLDKSPGKMYNRYIRLAGLGWGSLYPKFGCLGVIAISYSCIAPLVLGFATIGFVLIYLAVRYNMFYVLTNKVNTKGQSYAKALQQLTVGV